jgi:hypothetical protein
MKADIAFEVIDVLDQFFILKERSATLEGSAPLKAVQFCTPFIHGNAAGFHLWFGDSALIAKRRQDIVLGLTDEGHAKSNDGYSAKIERLVERGLLDKASYWYRKLKNGISWKEGKSFYIWTGLLVRPSSGVWVLVSGAFNRRSPIGVHEHVIPDTSTFVPLVLSVDIASAHGKQTWLEKEMACLIPMRPDVSFTMPTLSQAADFGPWYFDYFDNKMDQSAPGHYVGAYRDLTARESSTEASEPATCRLVAASGRNVHQLHTFGRFATSLGWSKEYPSKQRLQYAVLHNIFTVKGRWDGHAIRDLVGETPQAVRRLQADWKALYGEDDEKTKALDRFLLGYARSTHGPRIGEPYLAITPWVFVSSPPGWSCLVDGVHLDDVDGLRGLISTDKYHSMFDVWQFLKPCRFEFRKGAPLMRILPVPRRLLQCTVRQLPLEP